MLACADPALDGPVVLFQDVIEVRHRSMPAGFFQNTVGFELNDGWRITGVLVGVDYSRRRMACFAQRFAQKAFSRCCVAFSRQKEVDRRTAGVDSPV